MAEYIEREALKEHLKSYAGMFTDELGFAVSLQAVLDGIDFQTAADVLEVKHGRWESAKNPQWPAHSHDKCNLCGWWNTKNALSYDGNHKPGHRLNYCPNCGARMKEGAEG